MATMLGVTILEQNLLNVDYLFTPLFLLEMQENHVWRMVATRQKYTLMEYLTHQILLKEMPFKNLLCSTLALSCTSPLYIERQQVNLLKL